MNRRSRTAACASSPARIGSAAAAMDSTSRSTGPNVFSARLPELWTNRASWTWSWRPASAISTTPGPSTARTRTLPQAPLRLHHALHARRRRLPPGEPRTHRIYLVRGQDHTGGQPIHAPCNHSEGEAMAYLPRHSRHLVSSATVAVWGSRSPRRAGRRTRAGRFFRWPPARLAPSNPPAHPSDATEEGVASELEPRPANS